MEVKKFNLGIKSLRDKTFDLSAGKKVIYTCQWMRLMHAFGSKFNQTLNTKVLVLLRGLYNGSVLL